MYLDDDETFYDIILSHVPFAVVFNLFRRKQLYMFLTKGRRQWEWRCRAKLAVRGTSMNPQIGLFEEGSHFVVDIPSCRAHHPSINATIKLVKEGSFPLLWVLTFHAWMLTSKTTSPSILFPKKFLA
jgi:hypothetical protein